MSDGGTRGGGGGSVRAGEGCCAGGFLQRLRPMGVSQRQTACSLYSGTQLRGTGMGAWVFFVRGGWFSDMEESEGDRERERERARNDTAPDRPPRRSRRRDGAAAGQAQQAERTRQAPERAGWPVRALLRPAATTARRESTMHPQPLGVSVVLDRGIISRLVHEPAAAAVAVAVGVG